jgi:hypothetical protein
MEQLSVIEHRRSEAPVPQNGAQSTGRNQDELWLPFPLGIIWVVVCLTALFPFLSILAVALTMASAG